MAKAKVDVNSLSIEELRALEEAAHQRIEQLEEEKREAALETMEKAAAEVGMTPMELLKYFGRHKRAPKKAAPATSYRNPDNPDETWGGKGRKPAWVAAWLEAGKDLEELKVG